MMESTQSCLGDLETIAAEYERHGVVRLPGLLSPDEVREFRAELERYQLEDLPSRPADACTWEPGGKVVRNLWRLEQHHPAFCRRLVRPAITTLAARLTRGEPVLAAVETFNKPARVGTAVPFHQDNAYFCQAPPDMLTLWIALDPVTEANGPVIYLPGSHQAGVLPTRPSGVSGNSMVLADPPVMSDRSSLVGLLEPGDALVHHCQTIHRSDPNRSGQPRKALLMVYRGAHTQTDPVLKAAYDAARS
ncbi:phytanoyl-CoA dioxygenase family protein [Lignipirellula cremea]|uniref:1-deoxypentalenic acid 11-beta-hydroxylase n=1 Tax=Lignipirellula cremea TaxID=2528010 RepID=A0A518DUS1_9BACT|nr:phytanoyl-CoA dioxygenase family protein [Lignipirellula cremea]QDU95590.1 1-deoxypentalenic acid 11-beta-hydroxylase [Lignipirellula cremea]